jgi:hypothetical protein
MTYRRFPALRPVHEASFVATVIQVPLLRRERNLCLTERERWDLLRQLAGSRESCGGTERFFSVTTAGTR